MRRWTKFETVILVLTVVGLLSMFGVYAVRSGRPEQPWRVEVERTQGLGPEKTEPAQQKPDSLLEGEVIDLNSASLSDLSRLPGVGEVRAQAIVDYRTEHGPFGSVDELTKVKGIGPGIVEGLRPYVTVG